MSATELCTICWRQGEPQHTLDRCERADCPIPEKSKDWSDLFVHIEPKADACDHDFTGWRPFDDGNGGEQVCAKCNMGAMAYTLRTDF